MKGAIDETTKSVKYKSDLKENERSKKYRFDLMDVDVSDESIFSTFLNFKLLSSSNSTSSSISAKTLSNTSHDIWTTLNTVGEEPIDLLIRLFEHCKFSKCLNENYYFDSALLFSSSAKIKVNWCNEGKPMVRYICYYFFSQIL